MSSIEDNSIHLGLTSPPYNEEKLYDIDNPDSDSLPWKDYISLMNTIFSEVKRVLVPGGRVCINIANLGRYNEKKNTYYKPLRSLFEEILLNLGLIDLGEIIWWKGVSANVGTTWASWRSPSNAAIRDTHEYILVFKKKGVYPVPEKFKGNKKMEIILKNRFLKLTKSVWEIPAVRNTKHPCTYPDQLADNLITLYTFPGQTVLDPFAGSGTTARVAKLLGRNSISFEIVPRFQKMIELEISKTFIQDWFIELDN